MPTSTYAVSGFTWSAAIFIAAMAAAPGLLTYVAMRVASGPHAWAWAGMVTLLVLPIFVFLAVQLFLVKATICPDAMQVGGGLYRIRLPLAALRLDQARHCPHISELGMRTNGIGMPGLRLGWFQHRGRKVFVAVTMPEHAIHLPTSLDYDVIVAPQDPDGFLKAVAQAQQQP